MTRPDQTQWTFLVLIEFRIGGRTWRVGEVLNRRHLAIGPRVIQELLDGGQVEVA